MKQLVQHLVIRRALDRVPDQNDYQDIAAVAESIADVEYRRVIEITAQDVERYLEATE